MRTKRKSIKHYKKMIKWAKRQDPEEGTCEEKMKSEIQQNWFASSCPYCSKFPKFMIFGEGRCSDCPLSVDPFSENECCDELWEELYYSNNWKDWITNAEKVLEYIKKNG